MLPQMPKESGYNSIIWSLVFYGALIFTGIIYYESLGASIQFDDTINLLGLDQIHDFDSAKKFILSGIAGPTGRPLALLSFALQYYAWPFNPELLIKWNILLHLLNGVLVTALALNLGRAHFKKHALILQVAVLTGALWMLLPILASSSLFIIQRMTTLSTFFILVGLFFYTRLRNYAPATPEQHLIKLSIITIVFTTLAVLSKENGILLPAYILTIESTIFSLDSYRSIHNTWRIWLSIFLFLPLLAIGSYLILQIPYSDATVLQRGFTATEHIASQGYIIWTYLYRAFLPTPSTLGPFHDASRALDTLQIYLGIALFFCLFICAYLAIHYRKRYPLLAFATLWFLLGHLLESTTIPLELYFEHRNYAPLIGPVFALIAFLSSIKRWKQVVTWSIFAYISLIGLITLMTTSLWGKPLIAAEIWNMDNPKSVRATLHLAKQLEIDHDLATALKVLDRFNNENPTSLGLQIQALVIACALTPNENHSDRLKTFFNNAPTARFENWAVSQPEDFHDWLLKNECEGINFHSINLIVDAILKNPRYTSHPVAMHNLYVLKGIISLQYDDITNALKYFDTALTYHIGYDALGVALLVAKTHNDSKFINKWSYAAK